MRKNKIWTAFIGLTIAINTNAQDKLFLSKRDYNDSQNYKFTLEQVNTSTGAQTKFHDFQDYGTSYLPDYLGYNAASKNIVGVVSSSSTNKSVVVNLENNTETSFSLATGRLSYRELVVAGDNVYLIKDIYSTDTDPTKYQLMLLNTSSGTETFVYEFQTGLSQLRAAAYVPATNEIVISRAMPNIIVRYNIGTGVETTFNLDQSSGTDYDDIIAAKGKVYLFKSTYDSELSKSEYNLIELNLTDKSETQVHEFSKSGAWGVSMAYLPKTDDLFVLMSSGSNYLVNYNLTSDTEVSTFTLEDDKIDFGDLIVIPEETVTAVSDEVLNKSVSVYPNPAKDVLSFSKTVSNVKIYNSQSVLLLSGENTGGVDVSSLGSGLYIVDFDGQREKIVIAK